MPQTAWTARTDNAPKSDKYLRELWVFLIFWVYFSILCFFIVKYQVVFEMEQFTYIFSIIEMFLSSYSQAIQLIMSFHYWIIEAVIMIRLHLKLYIVVFWSVKHFYSLYIIIQHESTEKGQKKHDGFTRFCFIMWVLYAIS